MDCSAPATTTKKDELIIFRRKRKSFKYCNISYQRTKLAMGHPTLHFIVGSSTPIWTPHLLPWCSLCVSNMISEPPGIYIILFASFTWWHLWCFSHACLLSGIHVLCLVVPREMPVTSWFTTPWSNVNIYIVISPLDPYCFLLLLLSFLWLFIYIYARRTKPT